MHLAEETARSGRLQLSIAEAELEVDVVQATAPPSVFVEYAKKKKPVASSIKKSFRAR